MGLLVTKAHSATGEQYKAYVKVKEFVCSNHNKNITFSLSMYNRENGCERTEDSFDNIITDNDITVSIGKTNVMQFCMEDIYKYLKDRNTNYQDALDEMETYVIQQGAV